MTHPLYDADFCAWTQAQARLLRARQWEALDIERLADEIDAIGRRDRHQLRRQLQLVLWYGLRWACQPERRDESWCSQINGARLWIAGILKDSPSLVRELPDDVTEAYTWARQQAADQTGLPLTTFPAVCPWPLAQLQDLRYVPAPVEDETS
jgi:Domain of unknown function DUF29